MTASGFPEPEALERSLQELRALPTEGALKDSLHEVLVGTRELFQAGGAGLMMLDSDSVLRGVEASDAAGHMLEDEQEQLGVGPCVDTLTFDRVVTTEDLPDDDRWPTLTPRLAGSPIRALIGVPVRIGGGAVGALNVYRDKPGEWSDTERVALEAYARLVASILSAGLESRRREQLAEQLQLALDNRGVIDRAVGAVMAREGIGPVGAFNKLRAEARNGSRRVADVAAELLDAVSRGA